MPNKILILFAHPLFEKSNANAALVRHIPNSPNITFHDLYQEYPEFDVDMKREQELLMLHDIIIWHHPMYWYNCPPLLKQWIDIVLEHGWAYGKEGKALKGKILLQVITTGGQKENYSDMGRDRFTVMELLEPFNQTAKVCNMTYLPPYVVHGTHSMKAEDYETCGKHYRALLEYIENKGINITELSGYNYFNDWFQTKLG
ncbi:NAD(P)H oxidoreductase [Flavobacterium salilacus subsp. salilacus]|uniref:NAD(P)H-dependent oxidoreductase n=1 Tax=Flavobacterium TaxID=237 RepID=UPI001074C423|nr:MULTISPECIES: NAD(P)H-dependent oxidoreductase [Flavobacterium]KAF2518637.1 NAD(P)H oxidoreductase [Flavobacterium salilacus subsp. salilacus]MBE1613598.1 NAD(P)H-dependent oxidoreductase [Flavobacterium sp. SaA2.13]